MPNLVSIGKALANLKTDKASRMARAKEQGFDVDTTYYHGTGSNFDSFRDGYGGVYFSDSPEYANRYTTSVDPMAPRSDVESGRNIIPSYLRVKNTFDTRNPEHRKIYEDHFLNKWGNGTPLRDGGLPDWVEADDFQMFFDETGLPFDSAIVGEPPTKMPDGSFRPESSMLVTDESKIRSVNAAFDPTKKHSSDLLGSADPRLLAATALGTGTAVAAPKAKGIMNMIGDTALEAMSGVNRAVVDGANFLTTDQINAVLKLSGSDKRAPNLYDIPGIEGGTEGNYMEPGLLRQFVREASGLLSPI